MSAPRFFVDGVFAEGATARLERSDAHKIIRVLRLGAGDVIRVVDSSGSEYTATLTGDAQRLDARLDSRVERQRAADAVTLTIAQAVPKGQKMEFVVEKASELGVAAILPFTSERTIVRDFGTNKVERWRRIAKSAAEQSGRSSILDVEDPVSFEALLGRFTQFDAVLFPWEASVPQPLRDVLPALLDGAKDVLAVIGPEGGFSHDEAQAAQEAGACVVSLGSRILRTETAGLYVATVVDFLTGA